MPKKNTNTAAAPAAKKPASKPKPEMDPRERISILAEDVARYNNGEVSVTKLRGDVLVILLKDGRKYKINFNRDDLSAHF